MINLGIEDKYFANFTTRYHTVTTTCSNISFTSQISVQIKFRISNNSWDWWENLHEFNIIKTIEIPWLKVNHEFVRKFGCSMQTKMNVSSYSNYVPIQGLKPNSKYRVEIIPFNNWKHPMKLIQTESTINEGLTLLNLKL